VLCENSSALTDMDRDIYNYFLITILWKVTLSFIIKFVFTRTKMFYISGLHLNSRSTNFLRLSRPDTAYSRICY